jgi:peptidoglycan/LPS O-acetylase OafA/YrhL
MTANNQNDGITLGYRPDLQGMRGVAVLSVVLFHLMPDWVPGGFFGVDIFFVLSGYFISTALLVELQRTGSIDLGAFWARRIRRILPLSTVVLLSTCLIVWFWGDPYDLLAEAKRIKSAGLYVVNWAFVKESLDYFGANPNQSFVQHFWSLAVEEQFYVVWPIALFMFAFAMRQLNLKPALQKVAIIVAVMSLASFLASVFYTPTNQPLAFFGTLTRAWQLLLGALIACLLFGNMGTRWLVPLPRWPFVLALIFCIVGPQPSVAFSAVYALVPTVLTVFIIVAGRKDWLEPILTSSLMVGLGAVSYGWYLWHWPMLRLAKRFDWSHNLIVETLAALLALLLAVACLHAFENPIRHSRWLAAKTLRSLALGLALTGIAFLASLQLTKLGRDVRVPLNAEGASVLLTDVKFDRAVTYDDGCHLKLRNYALSGCEFGSAGGVRSVYLIGDSHAAHFFDPIDAAAKAAGWKLIYRTKGSCPFTMTPMWSVTLKRHFHECDLWREAVLEEIAKFKPELVFVASTASLPPFDATTNRPAAASQWPEFYREGEVNMFSRLHTLVANVVAVGDLPNLPEDPARCLIREKGNAKACEWQIKDEVWNQLFPVSKSSAWPPHVTLLDIRPVVCPDRRCGSLSAGKVTKTDAGHMTASFASTLTGYFKPYFK